MKDPPDLFPWIPLGASALPGGSKERAGHLLDLVHQESEEYEHPKDHAQVLFAHSVAVLEHVFLRQVEGERFSETKHVVPSPEVSSRPSM
ncbi:MAG: hypothetical protein KBH99_10485 [Syntrophobacteraceae bacterium]|nr:hypothetical protein [Syntrophobacteraceae bacterium]